MANFQDIKGFNVQSKSTDPTPYAQALIDNPYAGAWSSGGTKNTIVNDGTGSGSNTAGLAFGGVAPPGITADTETYNGTSWTEVNNLNAGRRSLTGTGTQTASLAIAGGEAGSFTAAVEKWNGTSWTEINDLNLARGYNPGSSGTTSAALAFGGRVDPNPAVTANTESFDGTSWTEVNNLNTARYNGAGAGVQPSSLYAGGHSNSPPGATLTVNELWNGTSWTESTDLNTGRNGLGGTGDTNTSVLVFGGTPPETSKTESWNGTSWTEVADLAAPSEDFCSSAVGGNTSALRASGNVSGSRSGATEEWTFSGLPPSTPAAGYADAIVGDMYYNSTTGQFKAIKDGGAPAGTWASGANVNTSRRYLAGVGSKTAGLIFGGGEPPTSAKTESYDGTAWTEVNDLNAAQLAMGSAGTSTSGMSALGAASPGANVEDWNGTSWSSNPHSLNSARQFPGGDGPSNDSALMVGGEPSPNSAKTEIYNGSSWTEVNDLNDGRNQLAAVGTTTAALAVGGSPNNQSAELWNGTSWTEVADLANGGPGSGASGDSALAIAFAGQNPVIATNEAWNGTSWTEVADLANARNFFGSSNNSGNTSAFAASGENDSTLINNTEEWSAADFQIKTVTTS